MSLHLDGVSPFAVLGFEVGHRIEVRGDFEHPLGVHLNDVAHVLVGGEHQLVVHHALGLVLVQHGAGVNPHAHPVLRRLVDLVPVQLGAVHEVPLHDALPDVRVHVIFVDAQLLVRYVHLYPLQQGHQLLLHVPGPPHRPYLHVVLSAPLGALPCLHPTVVNVKEGQMVAAWLVERFLGSVRMHVLVLRPEEDCVAHRQHGADGNDLVDASVLLR